MKTIGDILLPKHILTGLREPDTARAVTQIAETLQGDPRVKDWERLHAQLQGRVACMAKASGATLCLAHARTAAVSAMVMAAGQTPPEAGAPFRLIFVIGLPEAMSNEYLRIMGALTRIFRGEAGETALSEAAAAGDFLERLRGLEMGL